MSAAFDHRDTGVPELEWRRAAPWRDAPPLDVSAGRLVVLAAHPDDETLGAAGLLVRARAEGREVHVVLVTDGEGSHPGHPSPGDLARARRSEFETAMHALAPEATLTFLGVPDGGIRAARSTVAEAIGGLLRRDAPDRTLLVAPWWGDGHRDHDALGELALGFAGGGIEIAGYPVWMWHWADPTRVDAGRWRTLALDPATVSAKQRAIGAYRSQLEPDPAQAGEPPMLHENTLAHFARDVEVFVLPDVVSVPAFDELHARFDDPWGLERRWYERRKRALLLAALPREHYRRTLELGCAKGATTRALAARSETVVAVDASAVALAHARARPVPEGVSYEQRELPADWPEGRFDLIVLSELGYYWTAAQLALALDRIDSSGTADATLVLCHWRHPIADALAGGDVVHERATAHPGWRMLARHVEEDFRLDVLVRAQAPSVAAAEGLT